MLADPQSVTINAVAQSMPRVGSTSPGAGTFRKEDGTVQLTISHQQGKRFRRTARLDFSKIVADPLVPAQNQKVSMSAYLVIDHPITGLTNAEIKYVVDALSGYLAASSGAVVTKIVGGEI